MPVLLDDPPRAAEAPTEPSVAPTAAAARAPEVTVRIVQEAPATQRRRRLPRPGNVLSTLVALALTVAILLLVGVVTGFLHLGNPFATTTIDRSPPAVLKQLTNLSAYSAAQGRYQQTIDVEDDVSILPSFLAGEHTVFVAPGLGRRAGRLRSARRRRGGDSAATTRSRSRCRSRRWRSR